MNEWFISVATTKIAALDRIFSSFRFCLFIGLKTQLIAHICCVRADEMMIAIGLTKLSDIKANLCHFVYTMWKDDQKKYLKLSFNLADVCAMLVFCTFLMLYNVVRMIFLFLFCRSSSFRMAHPFKMKQLREQNHFWVTAACANVVADFHVILSWLCFRHTIYIIMKILKLFSTFSRLLNISITIGMAYIVW